MNNRKEKMLEMKEANEAHDVEKMKEIGSEITRIDYLKQILSKELDRVLNLL